MQMRRMSLVAFGGLAGLLLGLCVFLATPNTYVSKSVIRFDPQPANQKEAIDLGRPKIEELLSRPTLTTLIVNYHLYTSDLGKMPLEEVLEKMKQSIRISPVFIGGGKSSNKGPFFGAQVEFAYRDPAVAQRVVEDLTGRLSGFEVLDAANLPNGPVSPNPKVLAFIGLLGGLSLGGFLTVFRRSPKTA